MAAAERRFSEKRPGMRFASKAPVILTGKRFCSAALCGPRNFFMQAIPRGRLMPAKRRMNRISPEGRRHQKKSGAAARRMRKLRLRNNTKPDGGKNAAEGYG
nr:MAG TPA: hypothetical protein [Caudoviricetes sp.]